MVFSRLGYAGHGVARGNFNAFAFNNNIRSAERSCWYLLGMRCFNLIGHAITADTKPRYWPGDEVDANTLASDDYQKVTSERMSRLRDYVESDEFPSVLPV